MRNLTFDMRQDEDCQIDLYDEKNRELTRWFCDEQDIAHIVSLIKEELGEESYIIPDYF